LQDLLTIFSDATSRSPCSLLLFVTPADEAASLASSFMFVHGHVGDRAFGGDGVAKLIGQRNAVALQVPGAAVIAVSRYLSALLPCATQPVMDRTWDFDLPLLVVSWASDTPDTSSRPTASASADVFIVPPFDSQL
jgi:hypothetical protein